MAVTLDMTAFWLVIELLSTVIKGFVDNKMAVTPDMTTSVVVIGNILTT